MKEVIEKKDQKLIYIIWQDAHSCGNWCNTDTLRNRINKEMCIIEDVGWVVYEDEKEIHMCSRRCMWEKGAEIETDSEYGLYQRIPKAWIELRHEIKGYQKIFDKYNK